MHEPIEPGKSDWLVTCFALLLPSVVTLVYFVLLADHDPRLQQAAYTMGKAVQFSLPIVWGVLVQRRKLALRPPTLAGMVQAIAFGLLVLAVMLILYYAWLRPAGWFAHTTEAVRAKVLGIGIRSPMAYLVLAIFYCGLHSLLEEYYWRWFVFAELRRLTSLPLSVLVSSLGFTAHHVIVLAIYFGLNWETLLLSAAITVGGAVWALLFERDRSLYGVWASHLLVDAGIFAIGYDLIGGSFT